MNMGKIIGAIVVIAVLVGGIMLLNDNPAPVEAEKPAEVAATPVAETKPVAAAPKAEEKVVEEVAKTAVPASEVGKADADAAMADAGVARKAAASVGGEWRDIGKLLKKAKAKSAAGDFSGAVKLANKAKQQAQIGMAQAKSQAEFKAPSYLKY